jgi:glycosyltransferase involved in cell wall biosynthesis
MIGGEAASAQAFFQEHGIETVLVERSVPPKSGLGFYFRLLANLFSDLPYSVQTHTSREMQAKVKELAEHGDVDLWQCEWSPYAENVLGLVDQPVLVMAHNVESLIWQRMWENERNRLKRWYIKRQWKKFEEFERQVFSQSTLTVAVSEADAQLARTRYQAHRVAVVENGVDVQLFSPGDQARDPHEILFLGSLDWRANLDGVKMLLDEVLPLVLKQEPLAKLSIVGRKPPKWLIERIEREPAVSLFADVPDVRPYLNRCGVMAVPLRVGGGSRLKILEAMAAGCPVVSTAVGAEGLELEPETHYLQASAPQALAEALVNCIQSPVDAAGRAEAAHQAVFERYDWRRLTRHLDRFWRNLSCA